MTGIIKFGTVIFVKDEERSDDLIQHYLAEHDGNNYRIKVDRTLRPPYYELFLDYKKNGRPTSLRLFATSQIEKIGLYYFGEAGGGRNLSTHIGQDHAPSFAPARSDFEGQNPKQ